TSTANQSARNASIRSGAQVDAAGCESLTTGRDLPSVPLSHIHGSPAAQVVLCFAPTTVRGHGGGWCDGTTDMGIAGRYGSACRHGTFLGAAGASIAPTRSGAHRYQSDRSGSAR